MHIKYSFLNILTICAVFSLAAVGCGPQNKTSIEQQSTQSTESKATAIGNTVLSDLPHVSKDVISHLPESKMNSVQTSNNLSSSQNFYNQDKAVELHNADELISIVQIKRALTGKNSERHNITSEVERNEGSLMHTEYVSPEIPSDSEKEADKSGKAVGFLLDPTRDGTILNSPEVSELNNYAASTEVRSANQSLSQTISADSCIEKMNFGNSDAVIGFVWPGLHNTDSASFTNRFFLRV